MKILWIVNIIFPYPAKKLKMKEQVIGGWLNGLSNELTKNKDIELAIATVYSGPEVLELKNENITYYLIPGAPAFKYNKKLEKYWIKVNNMFQPDLVHIHGTEYTHGLAFLKAIPKIKSVVSIQGLVGEYAKVYYGNISSKNILKNITFRDILKKDNLFQQKKKFYKRGKYEKEAIEKADAIVGRTTWDYANTKRINLNEKYYRCNEILRKEFYNYDWNIENVERHTLFCSQALYPIKGIHYLLEAVAVLKKQYTDVKLYVAGQNILDNTTMKAKLKRTGYAKYIQKLIKKYDLQKHIIFTGLLNEDQMVKKLLKTHVFVLPSAIENSSNSLGEAMLLGMPCVASNTGGTMDLLEHNKEGYIYTYTESAICAEYISKIFEDDNLAKQLGNNAKQRAIITHNPEENVKNTIQIYKEVIGEK